MGVDNHALFSKTETKFEGLNTHSFVTFKDKQLGELLELNIMKEPFSIPDKYFVDCQTTPKDCHELSDWDQTLHFYQPLVIKGEIIKGKQLGRTIGIPTANLKLLESSLEKANELLPGVYYGICNFGNNDTQYQMIASLGTNVTLNENKLSYEILILHDFQGKEFYGAELSVELQGLIRPESKFDGFDVFIRAMECDVAVGKTKIQMRSNI